MALTRINVLLAVYDVLVVNVALYLGFWLRFEGRIPGVFTDEMPFLFLLTSMAYLASFVVFRMYDKVWRYASIREMLFLGTSIFFGSAGTLTLIHFIHRSLIVPRSVIAFQILLTGFLLGGARLALKIGVVERFRAWRAPEGQKASDSGGSRRCRGHDYEGTQSSS